VGTYCELLGCWQASWLLQFRIPPHTERRLPVVGQRRVQCCTTYCKSTEWTVVAVRSSSARWHSQLTYISSTLELAGTIQLLNQDFRLLGVKKYLNSVRSRTFSQFFPNLNFTTTLHFIWMTEECSSVLVIHSFPTGPDNFLGGVGPRSWSWPLPPRAKNEWSNTFHPEYILTKCLPHLALHMHTEEVEVLHHPTF